MTDHALCRQHHHSTTDCWDMPPGWHSCDKHFCLMPDGRCTCREFSWDQYVAWSRRTSVGRRENRPLEELLVIWFMGVGEEFAELLEPGDTLDRLKFQNLGIPNQVTGTLIEEAGDLLWYLARIWDDCSVGSQEWTVRQGVTLSQLAREVADVAGLGKKAYRKRGYAGLLELTLGRREEVRGLLLALLGSLQGWLENRGVSLDECLAANWRKLERRRAEGTVSVEGKRT
jgi:hypothetical protein